VYIGATAKIPAKMNHMHPVCSSCAARGQPGKIGAYFHSNMVASSIIAAFCLSTDACLVYLQSMSLNATYKESRSHSCIAAEKASYQLSYRPLGSSLLLCLSSIDSWPGRDGTG
jgi:hypothetical protein